MTRVIFALFCLLTLLFSSDIEIESKSFYASESDGYSKFSGDVVVTQGEQWIKSSELFVYFDKNQKPTKFEARGEAVAFVVTDDGRRLDGSAQTINFYPNSKRLELIGGAKVQERGGKNQVSGEKIVLDRKKGETNVTGGDGPARFIIEVDDE